MLVQQPVLGILTGMNAHGRPGVAYLAASVCSIVLLVVTLGPMHWDLVGAALAVTIPLTIANVYVAVYACRQVGMTLRHYAVRAFQGPILCSAVLAICLAGVRVALPERPAASLVWALAVATLVMTPLYWVYVLPMSIKKRLVNRLRAT